ncbi:L-2-hydroxyglutarate dehydrogenase, mitochondrial [Nilaparvata lugens]|uniref:L-2-hydroxyglutarate dehydrogenase, mitochondrial n=1 Tax=Nilaparvata lugens TaxID=108931 RepID=UPI00193E0D45|nr:L-2-hydroxyglutarate dehydrogenase, mitochondrial [Nilaparvata lugens]
MISFISYNEISVSRCEPRAVKCYDVIVVGGGIVGTGTALKLKRKSPQLNIAIVEKENDVSVHQSDRNSGVIHAGMYYKPGSLRAELCVKGMLELYEYCEANRIPHKRNGKLIVATSPQEVEWLEALIDRGFKNNVPGLQMLNASQIKQIEPHCEGLKAIYSPYTGIINFIDVCRDFACKFKELGGDIHLNFKVVDLQLAPEGDGSTKRDCNKYPISVVGQNKVLRAGFVLTCAGLYADQLAKLTDKCEDTQIIPFRGTYYILSEKKQHLVKGNIYPVPNPLLPFLGVHFTPKLDGSVWCGPTAAIALCKEGYKATDIDGKELCDMLKFKGFRSFIFKNFTSNVIEVLKSTSKRAQLIELRKYIPAVNASDLLPGPSGVQAQALDSSGHLVEDFAFSSTNDRILHCLNCPSPAATSSLAISQYLANKVDDSLKQLN